MYDLHRASTPLYPRTDLTLSYFPSSLSLNPLSFPLDFSLLFPIHLCFLFQSYPPTIQSTFFYKFITDPSSFYL